MEWRPDKDPAPDRPGEARLAKTPALVYFAWPGRYGLGASTGDNDVVFATSGSRLAWLRYAALLGGLLAFGLAIYGLVLLWRILPIYLEVPDGKRTAHYIVSLIATIVVMMVIGNVTARILYGDSPGTMMGRISQLETSGGPAGSMFGGAIRQAELMAAAEEDRYSPPSDGELTDRQVQEFIRVMDRAAELQADKEKRLQALSEKADGDQLTAGDLGELMSSVTDLAGMQGGQIEVVKTAGGNWAEHEWVRDSLRTAWIQKDGSDAIESNYELYQEYEEQLARYVAR